MNLRNRAALSLLLLALSLLCASISHAQNQNNFWVYGYQAGINFNTTPPSYQGGFAIQASEGAASVANPVTGELLFYTDGVTVWDASNNPMPNGTGLLGSSSGQLSSTSAAVICEKPGSTNQYYLFTIDEQFSSAGLRYNVVDMSLNGGQGDIVSGQKNISLFSTTSEKMCVIPNAQGTGFWLITHDLPGDTFFAFSITAAGINTTPVVSTLGGTHGNGAGFMKGSPQFNRIAVANLFFQDAEVFDFNNSTGQLSNPIILNYPFIGAAGGTYGIEFSCNGELLYVSDGASVVQFDLTAGNAADILATSYPVLSNSFSCYGLQLGPDRKIYISNGALDVINNPDEPGAACDYVQGAIANQSSGGGWGLPQWVYRVGDEPLVCGLCEPSVNTATIESCGEYTLPDGTTTNTSGQYQYTLVSAAGCDSVVNLTVNILSSPEISIVQSSIGCGTQSAFTIQATGNGPFVFDIPALNISNSTGGFTLGAGTYQLVVTGVDGCSASVSLENNSSLSCPADFDQDLVVGVTDLVMFNAAYGCSGDCCPYDLNSDNNVSVADLLMFIGDFGDYCD
jgi:hypothetical protein